MDKFAASLDEREEREAPASVSQVRFSIVRWSAWTPDEQSSGKRPEIPEVPMLLRRRASFADCLALRVAFDCAGSFGPMPAVFCSRYGEVQRSVEMLEALAKNEPLSPMTFGLSVHNATAALYSIARGDTSATSAIAAGPDSLAEGILEACGVLAAGSPRILVVSYDNRLPDEFSRFADEGDLPSALGLVLEPAGRGAYSLELARGETPGPTLNEPQNASVARFLKQGRSELEILSGARRWIWRRDA